MLTLVTAQNCTDLGNCMSVYYYYIFKWATLLNITSNTNLRRDGNLLSTSVLPDNTRRISCLITDSRMLKCSTFYYFNFVMCLSQNRIRPNFLMFVVYLVSETFEHLFMCHWPVKCIILFSISILCIIIIYRLLKKLCNFSKVLFSLFIYFVK